MSKDEDKTAAQYQRDTERVEEGFWPKVRKVLGRVPFLEDAVAAYYCALDPKTPFQVKAVIMGALAYFVLPTDMVPDIIAGLGFGDDAAVFYAAWKTVSGHVGEEHFEKARKTMARLRGDAALEG